MGGMTDRETGEKVFEVRPQWSPPVMGGMTGPCSLAASQAKGAAMEPARNGRDDRPGPRPLPAERGPQWSPPVMGGMTPDRSPARAGPGRPQWSPPVMGGMTLRFFEAVRSEGGRNG